MTTTSVQLEAQFVKMGKSIEGLDLAPILPVLASRFRDSIITNVVEHGRWDGNKSDIGLFSGGSQKWQKLAVGTKRAYKRQGISDLNRTLDRTGSLRASISVTPLGGKIDFTANKEYAAIHQYGGTTKPKIPVTAKMRKWAWAMYFETDNEMFRGLALTKKEVLEPVIVIPASPYIVLQPDDLDFAQDVIGSFVSEK